MRFPNLDVDYWTLVSGEERHRSSPSDFRIPSFEERKTLKEGDAAKLIFEIESEDEFGEVSRDCERMWVVVSEVRPLYFIGRLTNMPIGCHRESSFYLTEGVEVPFLPNTSSTSIALPMHSWMLYFRRSQKALMPSMFPRRSTVTRSIFSWTGSNHWVLGWPSLCGAIDYASQLTTTGQA